MENSTESLFSFAYLTEILFSLILVVALIFFAAYLFKKSGAYRFGQRSDIQVISGISLGARERIVVVKVENTRLVIGLAPGQMRTLHVLDEEDVVDEDQSESFKDVLEKRIKE